MRAPTAAAYLDVSDTQFRRIVDKGKVPPVQLTERGERMYLKVDLDAYLESRRQLGVTSSRPA